MYQQETITTDVCSWPAENQVYLTLDLECDFGTALEENIYEAARHTGRLADLIEQQEVPLTTFVQTELLNECPEAVEELRSCTSLVSFHSHSHTHRKRESTSIRDEIETSTKRFTSFFGDSPKGYRFPNGNVRDKDYRLLAASGYQFDASVFPTWRPRHFNNVRASTSPLYLKSVDLFELPFTVSRFARIPTGLAYCRLFGRPFTYFLTRSPSSTVVFNIHMHDLYTPETIRELPSVYRAIYSRNDHGFTLLQKIITRFREAGYTFDTLDNAHKQLRTQRTD